jgi:Tfp pilus assembly protein PilE
MTINQKGFGAVEAAVIVVVVIILSVAAWHIHAHRPSVDKSRLTVVSNTQASHNTTTYKQYKDAEVGLSFSYPARWGTVVKHQIGDPDRQVPDVNDPSTKYDYTLTGVPLFILPVADGNDNYMEEYAGCFTSLVLINTPEFSSGPPAASGWEQNTSSNNTYVSYKKVLIGNQKTLMIMDFEASTVVNAQDYCNGLSVYGSQAVSSNSNGLQKIDFLWSQTATSFGKNQPAGGLKALTDFKQDQSKYISDQDVSDLQATIKSMRTY